MRRTLLVRRLFPLLPPQQHPSARGVCSRTSRRSVRRSLVRARAHASARHRRPSVFAQSPAYAQRRVLKKERATGHVGRRIGGPPRAGACVLATEGGGGSEGFTNHAVDGQVAALLQVQALHALPSPSPPAPPQPGRQPPPTPPTQPPPPPKTHARLTPSHACSWLSPRARRRGQAAARQHLMRRPASRRHALWRPIPNTN